MISLLSIPTRTAGTGTTYPADINLITAKINEIAYTMNISPLTISAAVGLGDPAADANVIVAKVNEIIGQANGSTTTTPATTPAATKATAPFFGTIDDVNNIVPLGSNYSFSETRWGVEGQGPQTLGSNSLCSPGNIAGRLYAYVIADAATNRTQSDTVYSAAFSLNATANNKPTATISVVGGTNSITPGQRIILQVDGADTDAGDSVVGLAVFDNGVKIPGSDIAGASGRFQTSTLAAGSHSFTAQATDSKGATGLSGALLIMAGAFYTISDEGDSLSALPSANGFANPWPSQLQSRVASHTEYVGFYNYAVAGEAIYAQMDSATEKSQVLAGKDGAASGNFLFILAGINDMQGGASAQDAYNRLKALCSYYVAQGFRVVLITLTTSRIDNPPYDLTEFWKRVQAFNNLLRAGWRTDCGATVLLDTQTDSALGGYDAPLNGTYFRTDKIHYTETGAGRVADFAVRALPYLVANTPKIILYGSEVDSYPTTAPSGTTALQSITDDFQRADGAVGNGWLNSTYSIAGGKLVTVNPYNAAPLLRPGVATNVSIDGVIPWLANGSDIYGLTARYTDANNAFLAFLFDQGDHFSITTYTITSGGTGQLQSVTIQLALVVGNLYTFRLVVKDNAVSAAVFDSNNTKLGEAYQTTALLASTGQAGVWNGTVGAKYESVSIALV